MAYPPGRFGGQVRGRRKAASAFLGCRIRAYVYIDGFNFYYGAVRGTPYKWLDFNRMCELLLPRDEIACIGYFTALVKPRPEDPQQGQRQQTFLRALRTLPNVSIHYGTFLANPTRMPLARPRRGARTAEVIKTEEKGSDVNLASLLLADGFRGNYEVAVVISNDSDLVLPIQIVRDELELPVGVVNPRGHPSRELFAASTFFKRIRPGLLQASQFSETLQDERGTISKPAAW
jgi:NYN domain